MDKSLILALDRSARRVDVDGRLHVDRSHISKANVSPYYGNEIPGWQELGLDGEKVYYLYRDPVELERAAPTFANMPILSKHVPVMAADFTDPEKAAELKNLIVGTTGSEVTFNAPYLDSDLSFWDAVAIAGIDADQIKELSCGYRYKPVMEAGTTPDGVAYDGRMTQIHGNHLALVEVGRAGSDVVVADSNPFPKTEVNDMKMTKLGKALIAVLSVASPKLAADSALPGLVGAADRRKINVKELKTKLLALDEGMEPEQLDALLDSILDVEQSPEPVAPKGAVDEGPADKIKSLLAGKVEDAVINEIIGLITPPAAEDEVPEGVETGGGTPPPPDVNKTVATAMDGLRVEFKQAREAGDDVRPLIGNVALDSGVEIYQFALDHLKVDHKGVDTYIGLQKLFRVAAESAKKATNTPIIAADNKAVHDRFPGIKRLSTRV